MEKNDSPLESNKAYGEMPWVFFHRHVTNYLPFLDRRIRLPTYDLLGPTCAKHTGTQQKRIRLFPKGERNTLLRGKCPQGHRLLCQCLSNRHRTQIKEQKTLKNGS